MSVVDNLIRVFSKNKGYLNTVWSYDSSDKIHKNAIIFDINNDKKDEIIFSNDSGKIIILDSNGKELLNYSIESNSNNVQKLFLENEKMSCTVPAIYGNMNSRSLIFGTNLGNLVKLSLNGKVEQEINLNSAIRYTPYVFDFNNDAILEILVLSDDKKLILLNSLFEKMWELNLDYFPSTDLIVNNNQIIFGISNGSIISVSFDGKINWKFETKQMINSTPVFGTLNSQEVILFGSNNNYLYCLNTKGILLWKYLTEGEIKLSPFCFDINFDNKNEVVFTSTDDNVYVLDEFGQKVWTYKTDFWITSEFISKKINNVDYVIAGCADHNVYFLDAKGEFVLNYLPGISSILQQPGHYNDIISSEVGMQIGKLDYKLRFDSAIIGLSNMGDNIIVATINGKIYSIKYENYV